MMNSRGNQSSYLLIFVGIVASTSAILVGCAQSEADVMPRRPDVITIDAMSEFGALETARLHPLFVKTNVSLVELARWGHQQPGLPWELPQEARIGHRKAA